MNWLAHLVLAGDSLPARLGQIAGDFVRGEEFDSLLPEIQGGVRAHRALDQRADSHPAMRRARRRIDGPLHRFSPVLCDVFFDHFLAADFAKLGPGVTLGEFVDEVHADLLAHASLLPPRLRAILPRLVEERWLGSYGDLEGVALTLRRMQVRLKRPVELHLGTVHLERAHDEFRGDFTELWPALRAGDPSST